MAFEPAQEIVGQLQAAPLPLEAKAAMAALSNELGPVWRYPWSPFRCLFGFTEWTGSLAAFPDWPGVVVGGKRTHAFGPWQDEPETYADIAALTGNPGCEPPDQIGNNWALAQRDFASRNGGSSLLTALRGRQYAAVGAALQATWPAGADAGFGARYEAALPLFAAAPAPPPPAPPRADAFKLRLGTQVSFPIAGTDQDGQPYPLAPGALVSDDPQVCTALITTPANGAIATIASVGLGQTLVHGADLAIPVAVEASRLVHLTADLGKAVVSRIPAALMASMGAMMALALLMTPAGGPGLRPLALASIEMPKSYTAYGATWRFGRGELGALIVQCRGEGSPPGAIWQTCPK